jgi:hypothetical protein
MTDLDIKSSLSASLDHERTQLPGFRFTFFN